jgi:nitrogen fixation protein FixH
MTNLNETQLAKPMTKPFRLNGYHVAAMFVAFFGVIIAVNFTMAWFASSSWTGLVVKSSYVASQNYNEKIDTARNQKARGWRTDFGYSNNLLSLSVRDKDNQPIFFDKLNVVIGTPVSENKDKHLVLDQNNSGVYHTSIKLTEGVWAYELVAEGEIPYRFEGRFLVNNKGVGKLQ